MREILYPFPNLTHRKDKFMFTLKNTKVPKEKLKAAWDTHMEFTVRKH